MENPRITRIEWAELKGTRPRKAGCNARLGDHGVHVALPIARLWTEDSSSGFGRVDLGVEQARSLLGVSLRRLFSPDGCVLPACRAYQYPLWDLAGQRAGKPVYELAAAITGRPAPGRQAVPCYDSSLYFDDLDLREDGAAAERMAEEARQGMARGHRAFKLKVGRGALHMPLEDGTCRDIAVIRAVRKAVGPEAPLMIDANDGYNLNLAKRVLAETADCGVHFIEEPFHEDGVLYRMLKEWMAREGIATRIADGEGSASPRLLDWAREHLIDVVQLDINSTGLAQWLEVGPRLDSWSVASGPHHYGSLYGNYASCHLMAAVQGFAFAEWDEASAPGLDTSAYSIREGLVRVPDSPGFGLRLEETEFRAAVAEGGYEVSL